ncbi:MAG: DEAD/DEAH box helicase family protein [Chloroflexi bacterium]|nr:DEAD/DEAH box helicase family protein [Chloroflexota bacterium]
MQTVNQPGVRDGVELGIGDRVHLRVDPRRHGWIVSDSSVSGTGSTLHQSFRVALEGREQFCKAEDLIRCPEERLKWGNLDDFRRDLVLTRLRHRLTDTLFAYRASRTLFAPYQFRPVLKFLDNPDQRLLIADEVGLGKTIEAATIYLELKARLDQALKRILIVCPSRLRTKWDDELRLRFNENFALLDRQGVQSLFRKWDQVGDGLRFRAIASYETLRDEGLQTTWAERGIGLDLLIADEAHYMRNETTLTHDLGEVLTENSDAAVFLTATPLNLKNRDLFNLLRLLSPRDFTDPGTFEQQIKPNQFINQAARLLGAGEPAQALGELRNVEWTIMARRFRADPLYQSVLEDLAALQQKAECDRSRGEIVALRQRLLDLNTLSAVFTRTRKREVAESALRDARSITVPLTPAERAFYDGFLEHVREDLARRRDDNVAAFAIVMRERMAASCLPAVRDKLDKVRPRGHADLGVERSAFHLEADDTNGSGGHPEQASSSTFSVSDDLRQLAQRLGSTDSKFSVFEGALRDVLAEPETTKILVFSYFRGTLEYLERELARRGVRVGVIHGGVKIDDRMAIIDRFRSEADFRVLLSSEVGAEGLDFQFCNVLFNYDLPWNPMQVEQRIGRLDRFGQESEKIRIVNLALEDSVETRILERLYRRIGIFERAIGDLEAILGKTVRELSIEVMKADLTPEQQVEKAELAADAIERQRLEAEALEASANALLGDHVALDQRVSETLAGGRVISAREVQALVTTFLMDFDPACSFDPDTDAPTWLLRGSPKVGDYLQKFAQAGAEANGASDLFLREVGRSGGKVIVTFDADYARTQPLVELVTTRHLLAQGAREYWEGHPRCRLPAVRLEIRGSKQEETGEGYFFIYLLTEHGVAERSRLEPLIILDDGHIADDASARLLQAFQQDADRPPSPGTPFNEGEYETVKGLARDRMLLRQSELQRELAARHDAQLAARAASIKASFDAKRVRILETIEKAPDVRIRRMNEGKLRSLDARRSGKLAELEGGGAVSISFQLVASGRVHITLPLSGPASDHDGDGDAPPSLIDNDPVDESGMDPQGPSNTEPTASPGGSSGGGGAGCAHGTPPNSPGVCIDKAGAPEIDLGTLGGLGDDAPEILVLDGLMVEGHHIRSIGRLAGLRQLSLRETQIGDGQVWDLRGLSGLQALDLSATPISNRTLLYLRALSGLRRLDLSGTAINFGALVHLGALESLEWLDLTRTLVDDGGLVHLRRLASLRTLIVKDTGVTAEGLERLLLRPDVTVWR